MDVHTPECIRSSVPHALRDHCDDVNLVTQAITEGNRLCIIPTATALPSGTDTGRKVLGTVDTEDAHLYLLPGTPHGMTLP